ncbi:XRE family transcriptional regulator [Marinobacterium sp. D7]|uniref:helix-turn-helix domain-containing protein n=1 Tax=Marinobacterium ramblicola TaxID=2849041 RepID=UPI001C2DDD31|nr:XRE family transcriptional regulator [Marinobacterium ramblicola]MBV1788455.1 XRE family transcriptional regulator [Marinobacterium ramblicola]
MIGERLKRARAASGLSMDKLGKAVGVSSNMIKKYEHDQSMPSSSVLIKLADELGVRAEFFFRPNRIRLSGVEYRKRASTPKKILDRIAADVLDQAERWFELKNLWPEFPVPEFSLPADIPVVESLDDIEQVSLALRQEWQLGLNPLPELIDLLESKGVLVILTESDQADKFDGLQAQIERQPVMVVSSQWPGCRQRFTLAHELGHLLLHGRLPGHLDEEKACNRFASSFLLPAIGAFEHLGHKRQNIDWKELYLLKQEYGLSMAGSLYRCKDLGIISAERYKSLTIEFSRRGWKREEPGEPYPAERTQLFEQLVYRGAGEGLISDSKAAELLLMPQAMFRKSKMMEGAVA